MEDFTSVYTHIPMFDESEFYATSQNGLSSYTTQIIIENINVLLPCITFASLNSSKAQL